MHPQSTPAPTKRAAIYCRVSTRRQEDNYSLDSQESACRAFAQEHGFSVAPEHVYREVYSGAALFDRPKLMSLLEVIRARGLEVVVCLTHDRLSREIAHRGFIISEAQHRGIKVLYVNEPNDGSPESEMIEAFSGVLAKIERLKIMERSLRGKRERTKNHALLPASYPAFGYRWRPHLEGQKARAAYDIDPAKAPIAKHIYERLAAGGSLVGIQRDFAAEGIPSPTGKPRWPITTLKVIATNPLYKGEPEAWRHELADNGKGRITKRLRPEAERIKLPAGVVPPIVSPELWQRANAQLARNRGQSARHHRDPESFLLRGGFIHCPHCGRGLGTVTKLGRYRTAPSYVRNFGCPHVSMDAATLDSDVWELVESIIAHPDRIVEHITASYTADDPTRVDREALERRIAEVTRAERKQVLIIEALDDPDLAREAIARLKMVAQERKALEQELVSLEHRRQGWASGLAAAARLLDMFNAEQRRLESLSYQEKRGMLTWLGVSVTLNPAGTEPRWTMTTRIPMPAPLPEPQLDDVGAEVPGQSVYTTVADFPAEGPWAAVDEIIRIANTSPARDVSYRAG